MVQTIYIDPSTGNLGIGTTAAKQALDIVGNTLISGNVGIGTTNPQTALDVNGNIISPTLTGAIMYFATSNIPIGWLKCNGDTISRNTYNRLFNVISTIFGVGDNSTTYTLPDLRGEFLRGLDDGRGVDTGRVFGSAQTDALQSHRHAQGTDAINNGGYNTGTGNQSGAYGYANNTTGLPIAATSGGTAIRTATETRSRNIALLACIKY